MPAAYKFIDQLGGEIALARTLIRLREIDGLGMPPVRHIEEQYAQQDGATYLATWLERRIVSLAFELTNDSESDLWDAREALEVLMKQFAPGFRLQATLPNGAVRQLHLRYLGEMTLPRTWNMGDARQVAVLQCVAHNPVWYDPTSVLWGYALPAGLGDWAFPLGFPKGFGAAFIDIREIRNYVGTWKAYPVIALTGPVTDCVIENETTGDKLDFTGYNLAATKTITIDLTPGVKTVTHSTDGNIVDELTTDSDLGTWHITAHPEALGGNNTIHVTGTAATNETKIEIRFKTKYVGI